MTLVTTTNIRAWLLSDLAPESTAASPRPRAHRPLVEGDVPDGRRLFLDARLPARHRLPRRRRALAARDAGPDRADAGGRAARLPAHRRAEPARPGQHLAARAVAAALARQGPGPDPARVRGHRLRDHHHALGRRRDRAHHPQPVRAALAGPSDLADAAAAVAGSAPSSSRVSRKPSASPSSSSSATWR